ncbi:MAG: nucleotidyltransferase domain-containing protein [Nanoarchaeota archaeon]|nr:nucleotidyltransferase domain-containing protein [Nanoarchaeota archaeon]
MKTKLKIIAELERNHNGVHLREISRLVKTGLPNAKRFLEILEKEKVVRREKDANLVKFKLRDSERTIAYLKQVNTDKLLGLPGKINTAVREFLEELEVKPLLAIIFGSYAKGNYTKESDVDVLLVFQKLEKGKDKDIENDAKRISMRTNTKISPVYLDYENFEKNFLNKEHDFSREIRQDVIISVGIEYYYKLLWRFLR